MNNKISNSAERLRLLMEERNMRQIDVVNAAQPICQKFGIKFSKSSMSQYLSGKFEPDQDKIFMFAQIFDVSEIWLMGYDCERGKPNVAFLNEKEELIRDNKLIAMRWIQEEATPDELVEFIGIASRKLRK